MRKDWLKQSNADRNADEKERESVDGGENESVNDRIDDVESVGADRCGTRKCRGAKAIIVKGIGIIREADTDDSRRNCDMSQIKMHINA